ncbi:hypothetical protein BX616_011041 [Lobosporangium transversale]|uniref:Uncharacterized protein n=1 Tax=Lobosporangium transversale TaxID=64571 RepID=A0A1Y2H156_9FUNG|nr:hypothetical protein BCR41DRAFT_418351 [Lobosporangium transversale]KAF9909841.1 hypothetical protein BX616_011041 [Lobosporangium transversale]ORZ28255.1 hypothetical protein BCR41DRAFT_418351 [Lobosporangium transversale]|eukprot:XP_021885940.1 hypothetical protein BCR41DRAFT_418351 [Lobosporangium transversale]
MQSTSNRSNSNNTVFLGVDVGSGSARAALITSEGRLLAIHSTPFSTSRPAPDYFEQSSEEIWTSICTSVKAALASSKVDPSQVRGIGFDATCSLVAYTSGTPETARPVSISPSSNFEDHSRNIIMWCDHRAKEQAIRITETQHEILKNIGGTMSLEMELPKTLWLKDNMSKEQWQSIGRLFDLPDFLTWKATGDYLPSRCSVVCKWCYKAGPEVGANKSSDDGDKAIHQGWPVEFLQQIGLGDIADDDFQKLCGVGNSGGKQVHFAGEHIGGLSEQAAKELGLVPGTAVGGAVIDAYAGAIGTLGAKLNGRQATVDEASKRISSICGTSSCYLVMSDRPIFVPGVWGPFHGVMLPDMWVAEGGQSSTGQLIDHLTKSHPAYNEALEKAKALSGSLQKEVSVYEYLNQHLESLAQKQSLPDIAFLTKRLHMTPDHHGNRSPFADETMRGLISGLDLNSNYTIDGLAALYLATVQALALGTRQILDALRKAGYVIETICISGGLSMNRVFVKVLADIMQMPVVLPGSGGDAAVVVGAAVCGAVAYESQQRGPEANMQGMLWDAMTRLTEALDIIEPIHNPELQRFYENKFRIVEKMQQDQRVYNEIMAS